MDLLNPKSQVSSHLLWLNSPICVRPGLKSRELRGFYILVHVSINITCCSCPQSLFSSFLMKMGLNSIWNIFHSCFFLYNFFQIFLQYMYLFSAVIGLKVGSEIHFYLCHYVQTIITIEPRHEKTCFLGFWTGPTQLGCTVTDDGFKCLIFRILIVVGLYYLYNAKT